MRRRLPIAFLTLCALLAGCGGEQDGSQAATVAPEQVTHITATEVWPAEVEVTDRTIGRIESKGSPMLTSEVGGRLTEVAVDAGERVEAGDLLANVDPEKYRLARNGARSEVQRLQALVVNGRRQLQRQKQMLAENFITHAAFDETQTRLQSLQEQLEAAQSRLSNAERDLANARVVAPVSGIIDERLVSEGDFVRIGEPLFRLVSQGLLRVVLPFPETVAPQLKTGQTVYLVTPLSPDVRTEGRITELRPALGGARAMEVIVDVPNPGGWRPGASVEGIVVLDRRQSIVVPEKSVVRRPAGTVVYVVEFARAVAREVSTGIRLDDGKVEILDGLRAGEIVAVNGAHYLTDGTAVLVKETLE